jgi:hypothetical protein
MATCDVIVHGSWRTTSHMQGSTVDDAGTIWNRCDGEDCRVALVDEEDLGEDAPCGPHARRPRSMMTSPRYGHKERLGLVPPYVPGHRMLVSFVWPCHPHAASGVGQSPAPVPPRAPRPVRRLLPEGGGTAHLRQGCAVERTRRPTPPSSTAAPSRPPCVPVRSSGVPLVYGPVKGIAPRADRRWRP